MEWQEALAQVVAATKHERYRELCDDDHPDHLAWRERMEHFATNTPEVLPNYETQAKAPSEQAGAPEWFPCCGGHNPYE